MSTANQAEPADENNADIEQMRINQIFTLLPKGRSTILEIGSRSGRITRLLAERFKSVTALDLEKPNFEIPGVTPVKGDVAALQFEDRNFDCVICTEVLEHVPNIEAACKELSRVTRHELLIGVPFEQDRRLGRLNCSKCGKINPSWGHVNSFSVAKLRSLFPQLTVKEINYCGKKRERTNWLSTTLLDLGKNPWGTYHQEEHCIYCGKKMLAPEQRTVFQKVCSKIGMVINNFQQKITAETPIWMHVLFQKPDH